LKESFGRRWKAQEGPCVGIHGGERERMKRDVASRRLLEVRSPCNEAARLALGIPDRDGLSAGGLRGPQVLRAFFYFFHEPFSNLL
jgi:hypothetical protein